MFGTAMAISFGPKSPMDYSELEAEGSDATLFVPTSQVDILLRQ